MPVLTVEPGQIYQLIDQLDFQGKREIFEKLKPQILEKKWKNLFARIDKMTSEKPIGEKEIGEEVERARAEIASHRG